MALTKELIMHCETVVIKTDNGEVIINKSDYDPKTHKLAGEVIEAPKKEAKKKK